MIGADLETSLAIGDRLSAAAAYDRLGPDASAIATRLLETVTDRHFPGALIPSVGSNGEVSIHAVAARGADWRRLSPVLLAFAGPTLTSFDGLPIRLPADDPLARIASDASPAATATLRLPADPKRMVAGLRAALRARETLARGPELQRRPPEPTSWLLAQFQDSLNVGARDAAFEILRRLRAELRLDALNLKFLEVQALATFGEWRAIVDLPGFASLCLARRPPAITSLLLEALYHVHLDAQFQAGEEKATRARYEEIVRPLAQPMLALPQPASLTPPGWHILALEAWVASGRADLLEILETHRPAVGWLADKLPAAPVTPRSSVAARSIEDVPPIEQARGALADFDFTGSLETISRVLAAVGGLGPQELTQLREAEPFRSLLQSIDEAASPAGVAGNWRDWLRKAALPDFTAALEVARQGMNEWPFEDALADPGQVREFVAALDAAQSDSLAAERSAQALPFFVGWLRRDPLFPRGTAAPLYASLLTLLALGASRGRATYESGRILIEAQLALGLDGKAYRDLLGDVEELAGSGFGVEMVYWLLEVVEDLLRYASPDTGARQSFLHTVLSKLAPIYARLSSLQRAAVNRLAGELGWELKSLGLVADEPSGDSMAERLSGKRIAIYTLTESSSRQAKHALEELTSGVTVDCSADHVGTARLRAMAQGADIFVLTSLSASHAATDFVREHRGNKPLIYAQGRGFSSILRAVEDHLKTGA